jgi:glutamate decarboxylase
MSLHPARSPEERHKRRARRALDDFNPLLGSANPAICAEIRPPHERLATDPVPGDVAYRIIHDELLLDGSARLNLATFVTTWMEPEAGQLMVESVDKNMIDKDEYPQTAELERRCVAILADLWHVPDAENAIGCSTTGSSEAAMLAGMALKRRWAARTGAGPERRPNLVMGSNVQVCWEKFCRYWDVEPRLVPMEGDRFHLDARTAVEHCDENTIGVVAILGSTMDGSYEPVAEIAAALDDFEQRTGTYVPVHVDGASGGFVAPFIDPDLEWDFRIERVVSINASGHKYGLVYPGVGWALWRDKASLPEELIFNVNYLGGEMPTFALNFSRPGSEVIAQYYMFFRLGRDGYRAVQQATRDVATYVAQEVAKMAPFTLVSDGTELPVVTFTTKDDVPYDVFAVSAKLREKGWLVPAYTFPENREDLAVLRVVCRNGFSHDLADVFIENLQQGIGELEQAAHRSKEDGPSGPSSFRH